jgi:transposase
MIITRKIQVFVSDENKDLRKEMVHTIYTWRDLVRRTANMIVAHKFVQQQVRDFVYLKDEIQEKFYVKDILKEGKGMSEQNTTYRIAADMLKGKVPADIYSCLNQAVANTFKETVKDVNTGKASVRSYKNNIPMPFSAKALSNIHWSEEDSRFYFILFGIPFATALGRDRSNNKVIIERAISKEYKLCSSSLQIDDKKKKMFLLLCVDIPKKEVELENGKQLLATLDVMTPIVAVIGSKRYEIGTKEEFTYRRMQIQEAVRRCQIENRYNNGGKGRKRKTQAIERFHEKENNYVDTKLHTYSRMLVDLAVKNKCSEIVLLDQKRREDEAKEDNENGEPFVLRNWSYFGLESKIEYKAKMVGITLIKR